MMIAGLVLLSKHKCHRIVGIDVYSVLRSCRNRLFHNRVRLEDLSLILVVCDIEESIRFQTLQRAVCTSYHKADPVYRSLAGSEPLADRRLKLQRPYILSLGCHSAFVKILIPFGRNIHPFTVNDDSCMNIYIP